MSGPFIYRRKTTATPVNGYLTGYSGGTGYWFWLVVVGGLWRPGGCWRSLLWSLQGGQLICGLPLSGFPHSQMLPCFNAAGQFGAVATLTSNDRSQPGNFCSLQGLAALRGIKTHQRRCQTKISGQISFDGTGSSHPGAATKPQPALNPDFLLSKIFNTLIVIVQTDEPEPEMKVFKINL